MKLKKINGKLVSVNLTKYSIDWDEPSKSKFQFAVKQFLKPFWRTHLCLEEFPVPGSLMKIDFLNATKRFVIEVQGAFHNDYNKWIHKGSRTNFRKQMERDIKKERWCIENDFLFIEIFPNDLDNLSRAWFLEKYGVDLI